MPAKLPADVDVHLLYPENAAYLRGDANQFYGSELSTYPLQYALLLVFLGMVALTGISLLALCVSGSNVGLDLIRTQGSQPLSGGVVLQKSSDCRTDSPEESCTSTLTYRVQMPDGQLREGQVDVSQLTYRTYGVDRALPLRYNPITDVMDVPPVQVSPWWGAAASGASFLGLLIVVLIRRRLKHQHFIKLAAQVTVVVGKVTTISSSYDREEDITTLVGEVEYPLNGKRYTLKIDVPVLGDSATLQADDAVAVAILDKTRWVL